jgi:hypothetical protein
MRFIASAAVAAPCLFLLTASPEFGPQQASCTLAST